MFNKRRGLGTVLLLCTFASISVADQPYMQGALSNLQRAKAQLQAARHNKGGYRVEAIEYVNKAIGDVKRGMRFERRHNHAQPSAGESLSSTTVPDQPHMQAALDHLEIAKSNLNRAASDKGGWRRSAIANVSIAIDKVKQGIAAGE